jgi:hypothetical protein
MSFDRFSDDCSGCRPSLIDVKTGKVLPEESREMQAILNVWRRTTLRERLVFHRVTCLNSRIRSDLRTFQIISERMQKALAELTTIH